MAIAGSGRAQHGLKVAEREVDDLSGSVTRFLIVGAPDSYYDEVPAAFVELLPGFDVSEQDLIDYCLGQIATYKVPRYVRIVSEWPMSGTKIQKFKLAATLAQELRDRGVTSAPRLRARL